MDKDSKDYLEAKKQIENIFNKKTDFREIVLWYDPAKDFEEAISKSSFMRIILSQ